VNNYVTSEITPIISDIVDEVYKIERELLGMEYEDMKTEAFYFFTYSEVDFGNIRRAIDKYYCEEELN
jgi:hypothetical protein